MLLPALGKAREKARTIDCVSRLKGAMTFVIMYMDNNEAISFDGSGGENKAPYYWADALINDSLVPAGGYKSLRCGIGKAPADAGYYTYGMRKETREGQAWLRDSNITNPSEFVFLADSVCTQAKNLGNQWYVIIDAVPTEENKIHCVHYRHGGKANVAMADGSAKTADIDTLKSEVANHHFILY